LVSASTHNGQLSLTATSVIESALPFLDPLVFIEIVAVEPAQNQGYRDQQDGNKQAVQSLPPLLRNVVSPS
jgi:hypothetical protein